MDLITPAAPQSGWRNACGGSPVRVRTPAPYIGIAVCSAGLSCCITVLNLASRFVMSRGGFVASGGPYEIAHPAPGWILAVPASIILCFVFGGISILLSRRTGGFSLLPFAWSGLFLSLGFQFADMGMNPPGDGGTAWGWIVCAAVFVPMGLAPLAAIPADRFRRRRMLSRYPWLVSSAEPRVQADRAGRAVHAFCAAIGAISGTVTGFLVYRLVTG